MGLTKASPNFVALDIEDPMLTEAMLAIKK
jgi:hypothetical protein